MYNKLDVIWSIDMGYVISVINEKGGVGKSSIVFNCSWELSKKHKILLVDLDGQRANLSWFAGVEDREDRPTMLNVLSGGKHISECILNIKNNLDIVPANSSVIALSQTGSSRKMKAALNSVKQKYDFIFIDVNPDPTIVHTLALTSADYIIIPMLPDVASLEGNKGIAEDVLDVQEVGNPNLKVMGLLFNKNSDRTLLSKQVMTIAEKMADQLNTTVFSTKVRNAVALSECPTFHQGITDYAPNSAAAADIRNLCSEIERKCKE